MSDERVLIELAIFLVNQNQRKIEIEKNKIKDAKQNLELAKAKLYELEREESDLKFDFKELRHGDFELNPFLARLNKRNNCFHLPEDY